MGLSNMYQLQSLFSPFDFPVILLHSNVYVDYAFTKKCVMFGLACQYWLVSVCQTLSKLNLRLGSIVSEAILKKGTDIQQTDNHSASKCLSCVNIS